MGKKGRFALVAAGCLSVAASTLVRSARADEPAPAADAAKSAGKDIVRLKNGGMVRGSIVELIPNEAVVILLATGETRRIAMADVDYAGPEGGAPTSSSEPAPAEPAAPAAQSPKQQAAPEANTAEVQFVSRRPVTVWGRSTPSGQYEKLCTTPCTSTLPRGYAEFLIAEEGTRRVNAGGLTLTGNGTVEVQYKSRAGVRIGGASVAVAGVATGVTLIATGEGNDEQQIIGGIVTAATLIAGVSLLAIPNGGSVKIAPAMTGLRARETPGIAWLRSALSGAGVVVSF